MQKRCDPGSQNPGAWDGCEVTSDRLRRQAHGREGHGSRNDGETGTVCMHHLNCFSLFWEEFLYFCTEEQSCRAKNPSRLLKIYLYNSVVWQRCRHDVYVSFGCVFSPFFGRAFVVLCGRTVMQGTDSEEISLDIFLTVFCNSDAGHDMYHFLVLFPFCGRYLVFMRKDQEFRMYVQVTSTSV